MVSYHNYFQHKRFLPQSPYFASNITAFSSETRRKLPCISFMKQNATVRWYLNRGILHAVNRLIIIWLISCSTQSWQTCLMLPLSLNLSFVASPIYFLLFHYNVCFKHIILCYILHHFYYLSLHIEEPSVSSPDRG